MQIDREKFIFEILVRKQIREILKEKKGYLKEFNELTEQDKMVRNAIRQMIVEAKKSPIPHDNTGINVLEDTLKKIIPIIRDAYFSLTSDVSQRRSFRAHMVNGFINSLRPARSVQGLNLNSDGGEEGDLLARPLGEAEGDLGDVGANPGAANAQSQDKPVVDVDGDGIPDAKDKFIETEPDQEKSPEEQEVENFSVEGEDSTGRNMALNSFKKIEKNITDAYSILDTEVDKNAFYEYGITNLKLYFDRFEDELSSVSAESEEGAPV